MTNEQIVDNANKLANRFYRVRGYEQPMSFKFYKATHPAEIEVWEMACLSYDIIEGTCVQSSLDEIEPF